MNEEDVFQGHKFVLIKENSSGVSVRYADNLRANVREDDPSIYDDDLFAIGLLEAISKLPDGEDITINIIAEEESREHWGVPSLMFRNFLARRKMRWAVREWNQLRFLGYPHSAQSRYWLRQLLLHIAGREN